MDKNPDMGADVPRLFDPVKVQMSLERAQKLGPETFLLKRASEDLIDRLAAILRDFAEPLDFATPFAGFAEAITRSGRPSPRHATGFAEIGEQQHDLIVSGLALHKIDDLPGALIRLRRALKPDGLFLAVFAGGETLRELREVVLQAESELAGRAAMRVFPAIDVRIAGQLLQRAGFALPVADFDRFTLRYADLFALIRDLRAMGEGGAMLRRQAPALTRAILLRAAALYAQRHADADGRLRATVDLVWMSGWAPHASQQQPLRPGSAKMRLADALAAAAKAKR